MALRRLSAVDFQRVVQHCSLDSLHGEGEVRIVMRFQSEAVQPQEDEAAEPSGQRSRPSRIPIETCVMVTSESLAVEAIVCDVSESGLKIELDEALPPGPVSIKLPGFPIFTGEVRWRDQGRAGLRFLRPIPWEYLTTWIKIHGVGRQSDKD